MKRIFLVIVTLVCILCPLASAQVTNWNIHGRPNADWFSGNNTYRDVPHMWMKEADSLIGFGIGLGTGKIWYVDSNQGTAVTEDGKTWNSAFDTTNEAISASSADSGANRGDVILWAPGHTETLGDTVAEVDFDVAGMRAYSTGIGDDRALFDYTDYDTGSFVIGADGVEIYYADFKANVTDVNEAASIEAGSVRVKLVGCKFFVETEGTDDFLECIDSRGAASDRLEVIGCTFDVGAGACNAAIAFADSDYARITCNTFYGDYAIADVNNGVTASNHITILGNVAFNGTIGGDAGLNTQPCVELVATTTGVIAYNALICNEGTPDAAVVGADMYLIGNVYSEAEAASAAPMWLTTDTAQNIIGYDNNNNAYSSSSVVGNDEGTIIERLEQVDVDTSAIVADTAAMDTSAELVALVDPNYVTYDAPRLISDTTGAMTIANGYDQDDDPVIFTVTGDIMARACAYATTQVTSTSSDTLTLGVTGDTACLLLSDVVDGTAFDVNFVWTLTQAPDTTSAELDAEWVVIPGGLDIKLFIDDHGLTAGVMVFYLQWIPLSADAAVVGAAP